MYGFAAWHAMVLKWRRCRCGPWGARARGARACRAGDTQGLYVSECIWGVVGTY